MIKRLALLLFALAALPMAAHAQSARFEEGYKAYQNKDYSTALYYWKQLADAGDVKAQYNLAIMYLYGRGVPQDTAQAYMWFLLARDGHMDAAEGPVAELEGKMISRDLNEGLRLRDEWRRAHGY